MGMHRDLHIRKVLVAKFSSDKFIGMTLNYKLYQVVILEAVLCPS